MYRIMKAIGIKKSKKIPRKDVQVKKTPTPRKAGDSFQISDQQDRIYMDLECANPGSQTSQ